jgi:hypothetical protein
MAIDLSALFGQQPDYSAFISPAEQQRLQSNAGQQALLNAAISALSMTGQTRQPISTGQVFAGALGAGMEGYNQSFDRTLKQMVTGMQLEEFKRKRQAQELARQAVAPQPVPIPMATGKGSQLEMLSRPEFGGDMAAEETVSALRGNLPTKPQLDINKLIQAISIVDPVEAAKLMTKEDKVPDAIKQFQMFSKMKPEEQKAFLQFKQASAPTSIISMSEKGLDKIDAERVGEFSSAAAQARNFATQAGAVNSLLKGKGGGDVVKVGAEIAKTFNLKSDTVTANDLANSIAVRGATGLRAPGSGSTSDLEFKSFISAFPSLSNSETGRNLMAKGAEAFAKRSALLSDKARELYKAGKYSDAAIAAYDSELGAVLDQKEFAPFLTQGGAAPKPRLDFRTPAQR